MHTTAVEDGFGVVVHGANLTGAGLSETVHQLEQLLDEHLLLVFREAGLDEEEFIALGRTFGELENFNAINVPGYALTVSNLGQDGKIRPAGDPVRRSIAADGFWHTDHTYMVKRARYSFLRAEVVPDSGGETQFADTRAAYDALAPDMKERIDDLVALHSIIYSRSLAGYTQWDDDVRKRLHPVPQPLVYRNSQTGRKSLYIASHIAEIFGLPTAQARSLATDLIAHATQPEFVYSHNWNCGDIVVWDDRATMHRRAPYRDLAEVRKLQTMRVLEDSDLYDPDKEYVIS